MRFLRRSLVGLFLLSLTLGLLSLAGKVVFDALETRWAQDTGSRPARERVFTVNVIPISPEDVTPILASFGEVKSRRTLDLRAPIAGRIVELSDLVQEGGAVEAGDFLARIDPADAQTAVDVALTDLTEAEADLRDAERTLALAQDDLRAAQAQAELRARALARQKDLRARGVGSETNVETAEISASSADQAVLSRRQSIQQAEARVDQTKTIIARRSITVANAERLLAQTEIFADFDGRLSEVTISAGGIVATNERLAQLVDPLALEVSFRVSTAQYARLLDDAGKLVKSPVRIVLDVLGTNIALSGRLVRESAAVGEGTTGRVLFAEIDAPKGLRPGDFVTVEVSEPILRNVAKIPATAVDSNQRVLALGPEDRLVEEEVQLLRRQGDDVIIRARALEGREIVAERSQLLGAGIKVNPLRGVGSPAPAAPETVELDDERRAKLIAFVENNARIPKEVKARMLGRLAEPRVPAQMVERIESRMGS